MVLTDNQIKELAERLKYSNKNVYLESPDFEDGDWERLREVGGMFRCEECDMWTPVSEECPDREDCCTTCGEDEDGAE